MLCPCTLTHMPVVKGVRLWGEASIWAKSQHSSYTLWLSGSCRLMLQTRQPQVLAYWQWKSLHLAKDKTQRISSSYCLTGQHHGPAFAHISLTPMSTNKHVCELSAQQASALQEASDKGHLHRSGAAPGSLPDLSFVLATALDIANGMACIHAHDVIHRCLPCFTALVLQHMGCRPLLVVRTQQSRQSMGGVFACCASIPDASGIPLQRR